MKKLILLSILLIVGCEEPTIEGCMTDTACNYNIDATKDDGICLENDCNGECGGSTVEDDCGGCDANVENDCIQDCAGEWGGVSVLDDCGYCTGGTTALIANFSKDCAGECDGDAVSDIDENCYATVQIGDQLWMAENLKTNQYNDGSEISTGYNNSDWTNLSIGAYALYNDDSSNTNFYGNLYNWYAVDSNQGLCIEGWHVPSYNDFLSLRDYLGGIDEAGGKMKSTGTIEGGDGLWNEPNESTNSSGFNALPAGMRDPENGEYRTIGELTLFWTSTLDTNEIKGIQMWLDSYSTNANISSYNKQAGFSIRCIKD